MKKKNYHVCMLAILSLPSCCNRSDNDTAKNYRNELTEIVVQSDYRNEIRLSEIVEVVDVIPLETSELSVVGSVRKVDFAGNRYYVQDQDRRVLSFAADGSFLTEIGSHGKSKSELLFPKLFVLDSNDSSSIQIVDNFKYLKKYSVDGEFLGVRELPLVYEDVCSYGNHMYYHINKSINYGEHQEHVCFDMAIENLQDSSLTFLFPFDEELYPNGSLKHGSVVSLIPSGDGLYYSIMLNDTIYQLNESDAVPRFVIRYDKCRHRDLSKMNGQEISTYFHKMSDREVGPPFDIVMSGGKVWFHYDQGQHGCTAVYDRLTHEVKSGTLIDDLTGLPAVAMRPLSDGSLLYLLPPTQLDMASVHLPAAMMEKLEKVKPDDNPVLIRVRM